MKQIKNVLLLLYCSITLIGCKKSYNKIDITFIKSESNDSIPIKYCLFKLSDKDTALFNKYILEQIIVNKHYVFDSLPDGKYVLEYSNLTQDTLTKVINLKNNLVYETRILYDSLPLEKYYNETPIHNLKEGEKYTFFRWGGSIARMESFYDVTKLDHKYYLNTYSDTMKLLNHNDIIAIKKFEAELLALNNKGFCRSSDQMTNTLSKGNQTDTIREMTCNWYGYESLMRKIYKRH